MRGTPDPKNVFAAAAYATRRLNVADEAESEAVKSDPKKTAEKEAEASPWKVHLLTNEAK
jgi:hypothetical protein